MGRQMILCANFSFLLDMQRVLKSLRNSQNGMREGGMIHDQTRKNDEGV